jgi:hypothetical protein
MLEWCLIFGMTVTEPITRDDYTYEKTESVEMCRQKGNEKTKNTKNLSWYICAPQETDLFEQCNEK